MTKVWDDNKYDKQMVRNQVIAIVLMSVLLFAWFKWFMPAPPKQPQAPVPSAEAPERPPDDFQDKKLSEGIVLPSEEQKGWAALPPPATESDPAADETTIQDEHLRLTFTAIGGRLKRAEVLLGENGASAVQLVPESNGSSDTEKVFPMGLRFSDDSIGDALDYRRFEPVVDPSGREVTFTLTLPGTAKIQKVFRLGETPYLLDAEVRYENLENAPRILGMDKTPAYWLNWGPNVSSGDEKKGMKQSVVWRKDDALETMLTSKIETAKSGEPYFKEIAPVEWVAVRSAYFVVATRAEQEKSSAWISGNTKSFRIGLTAPRMEVSPGTTDIRQYQFYIGPNQLQHLAKAWPTLKTVLRFFDWDWMDWFAILLLRMLNWFYDHVIANYGVAIIFLTVVVRVIMYPLTLKSMKSMKKMQLLAPEMQALREKYKEDPQELNKQMMMLYRDKGANPFGGCLPMFLQMPVFFALYRMLWNAFELRGAPFIWWMTDMSEPDRLCRLPFMQHVPFLGTTLEYLNLLPILMGVAMVVSQKVMPVSGPAQNQQQKIMMIFMPVFFSFICYNMAAGLNLYILTSTVLGIVQQYFTHVNKDETKKTDETKRTIPKRRHFYTAAQARKRQFIREAKQARKNK